MASIEVRSITRVLVFFVLLSLSAAAHAAVRFDVILGYNGASARNAWVPVTCELQNNGPSFNAVIEVSSSSQGEATRLNLELPSNTQKRVIIPVFAGTGYRDWNVRLLTERGKVVAEPNYVGGRRLSGLPALGAVSRNASGLPTLPSIRMSNPQIQPIAVRLQPELFPDNPLVLEGLPAVYLNSERAAQLSVPQVNALLAWLQHGGHLILGVEQVSDITATEWLRKMMPCELTANSVLKNYPEFEQWIHDYAVLAPQNSENRTPPAPVRRPTQTRNRTVVVPSPNPAQTTFEDIKAVEADADFQTNSISVVTGTLRDGKVILGSASTPLAIRASRGLGQITVLTFSPEREPFLSWKNRAWFWAKMTGIPSDAYRQNTYNSAYNNNFNSDGAMGAMIDSKQIRKLSVKWLMLLLGAYLVVIGPLDYYLLKKLNRQMLTWITFPVYVLGFSGLIYVIGFHLRAGDLEYNELHVVDILPNSQLMPSSPEGNEAAVITGENAVLRGKSYCSIYSPANEKYQMVGDQSYATLRNEYNAWDAGMNNRASVVQRGNGFQAETFVPIWTPQLLVSDWLQPAPLPLALKVEQNPQNNNWVVTIDNKTTRVFTRAHIVLGGRIFDLGDLPAEKTSTFTLTRERGAMLSDFTGGLGAQLQNAANNRRASFGNQQINVDVALGAMAISFPSLIHNYNNWDAFLSSDGLDLADKAMHGHGILFAWDADHSFINPINRFTARRSHRDTLLRLSFPLQQSKAILP